MKKTPGSWYHRGYLPHFDARETLQFVTFRLFDSLPQNVLESFRKQIENGKFEDIDAELRKRIEYYLDQGYGSCFLKDEKVAFEVEDTLLFDSEKKYKLFAWVSMPNHVHFLARSLPNVEWSEILHSIKSYTAKKVNKILNRTGIFGNANLLTDISETKFILSKHSIILKTIRQKQGFAKNRKNGVLAAHITEKK